MLEYLDKGGLQYALTKLKTNLSAISSSPTKDIIKFTKTASISGRNMGNASYSFIPLAEIETDLTKAFTIGVKTSFRYTDKMRIDSKTETTASTLHLSYFKLDFASEDGNGYVMCNFLPKLDGGSTIHSMYLANIYPIQGSPKDSSGSSIRIISAGNKLFIGYYSVKSKDDSIYSSYQCDRTVYINTEVIKNATSPDFTVSVPSIDCELFYDLNSYNASDYNKGVLDCGKYINVQLVDTSAMILIERLLSI